MTTIEKILEYIQDEENEFSVLGEEPTRYECGYMSALRDIKEIIEENEKRLSIDEFLQKVEMSARLRNILENCGYDYIDEISGKTKFLKLRNAGKKTWEEFERLALV